MLTRILFLSFSFTSPVVLSPPPENIRVLFDYFCRDPSAHHLAKFSLYAGSSAKEVKSMNYKAVC